MCMPFLLASGLLSSTGYPMMPPYWVLGFHLCRWGYRSTNETRSIARRMHEAKFPLVNEETNLHVLRRLLFLYRCDFPTSCDLSHVPLCPQDVQWNDLDYADKRRVFTFDPVRFGDLPQMVQDFHQEGMRYILILASDMSCLALCGSYDFLRHGACLLFRQCLKWQLYNNERSCSAFQPAK